VIRRVWLTAAVVAMAREAAADPPRRAVEASVSLGYGHALLPAFDRSRETSSTNGGFFWSLGAAYRSRYLFIPWIEIGSAPIYRSVERVKPDQPSTLGQSRSSLSTAYLAVGPAVAFGPARLRAGMGLYRMQVESSFGGHTIDPAVYDLGYLASYRIHARSGRRGAWGLDLTALLISEAQLVCIGLSLVGSVNPWIDE
jgi:hypothetical protein